MNGYSVGRAGFSRGISSDGVSFDDYLSRRRRRRRENPQLAARQRSARREAGGQRQNTYLSFLEAARQRRGLAAAAPGREAGIARQRALSGLLERRQRLNLGGVAKPFIGRPGLYSRYNEDRNRYRQQSQATRSAYRW